MRNHIFFIIFVLFLALLTVSCSTTSQHSRGSLSDAMEKAEDDYEGERTVEEEKKAEYEDDPWEDSGNEQAEDDSPDWDTEEAGPYGSADLGWDATFNAFFGAESSYYHEIRNRNFDVNWSQALYIEFEENDIGVYLRGGMTFLQDIKNEKLNSSSNGSWIQLFGGGGVKFYFPLTHFWKPYGKIGFDLSNYGWKFKNALETESATITHDSIVAFIPLLGLGSEFLFLESFALFLDGTITGVLYSNETTEGFTNDVFSPEAHVVGTAGLKFLLE